MDFIILSLVSLSLLRSIESSCMFNFARDSNVELEIWPPPQHLKFKPGKNIYLECRLKGSTNLGSDFKWFTPTESEVPQSKPTNESYFSEYRGNGRLALYILTPNEDDVGQWTCSSTYGEVIRLTTTFNLVFSNEMSFFATPEVQMLNLLDNFTKLNCTVKGQPSPEIEWRRNGRVIPTGGRYEVVDDGLKIRGVTADDKGLYECRVYIREQGEVLIKHINVEFESPEDVKSAEILSDSPQKTNTIAIAFSEPAYSQLNVCDFETLDLCGFLQDVKDDFDWDRLYGETPTIQTGPFADHTFGTNLGHYMYIESSWPRHRKDKARLISPTFKGNVLYCITFWYHMHGQEMGEINVYKNSSLGSEDLLWGTSKDQGKHWKKNQIMIETNAEEAFQVIFEGVVGPSFTSDAALDDIQITYRSCDDPT